MGTRRVLFYEHPILFANNFLNGKICIRFLQNRRGINLEFVLIFSKIFPKISFQFHENAYKIQQFFDIFFYYFKSISKLLQIFPKYFLINSFYHHPEFFFSVFPKFRRSLAGTSQKLIGYLQNFWNIIFSSSKFFRSSFPVSPKFSTHDVTGMPVYAVCYTSHYTFIYIPSFLMQ